MKQTLHPDVTGRSGRVNGYVFAIRKATGTVHNYAREFVTPANPQTSYQITVRQAFAQASQAWSTLSESVRTGWNTWATTYYTNQIDPQTLQPYAINGQSLYVKTGIHTLLAGYALMTTAPTEIPPTITPAPVSISNAASTTGVTNVVTLLAPNVDYQWRLRISTAITAGYAIPRGALRVPWNLANLTDAYIVDNGGGGANIEFAAGALNANWRSEYQSPVNGSRIGVGLLALSEVEYLPAIGGEVQTTLSIVVT